MTSIFLALGSNLQDPVNQVKNAIKALNNLSEIQVTKTSSLYRTKPVGLLNQPDFVNAVIEITTTLSPEELLQVVLKIEQQHDRIRTIKNGPRTLDIDILLYGNLHVNEANLQIPHPRMKERSFVVLPLAEIAPDLVLPCKMSVRRLSATFKAQDEICLIKDL